MRDTNASLPREKAAHRKQALAAIGQELRQEYDVAQPLPDRLSDLVKKIVSQPARAGEQALQKPRQRTKRAEVVAKNAFGSSRHQLARPVHDQRSPGFAIVGSTLPKVARTGFGRNEGIYLEGDPVGKLYKVISGAVRACRVLVDGRRQIGAFYLPGDFFGLEGGEKHVFSVDAVTDVRLLVSNRTALASRAKWDNDVGRQLWKLMERELQTAQDHVRLLIKTAPERVASFLLEMAGRIQSGDEVELPMSRQDIADYLGLTIETVSRTLTQLENASVIALPYPKRIVLRNRTALKRLAAGASSIAGRFHHSQFKI